MDFVIDETIIIVNLTLNLVLIVMGRLGDCCLGEKITGSAALYRFLECQNCLYRLHLPFSLWGRPGNPVFQAVIQL